MTIFLSIVSAVIAALITHYLTLSRIKKSDLARIQNEAYSAFISAATRLAVSRRLGDTENEYSLLVELNEAKSRILTCGTPEVVSSMSKFWAHGATLEREQEILAFKNLVLNMRTYLGHKKHDILDVDISDIIFKLEPSSYSYKQKNTSDGIE